MVLNRTKNFHTTIWTRIRSAPDDPQLLTEVLETYWSPIHAFLRRTGYSEHEAEDLTQSFITDRLLQPKVYKNADSNKGRFRNYLLKSLKHYLIDRHRAGRHEPNTCSLDSLIVDHMESSQDDSPESAFEKQWAITVFQQALDRLQAKCESSDQHIHWQAFPLVHPEVVSPKVQPSPRPTNDQIAEKIGARDAAHVSILLNSIRRNFKKILHEVVVETLDDPTEFDSELALLRRRL